MSVRPDELLLVAGEAGGKSTFAGGLYHHVQKRDDLQMTYNVMYGNEAEFKSKILSRMLTRHEFPDQTEQPYIVNFRITGMRSNLVSPTSFDLMDIRGESQENAVDTLVAGNYDAEDLQRAYQEDVKTGILDDKKRLDDDQWRITYIYRYLKSEMVVFILNLHKIIIRNEEPRYSIDFIRKAAREKEKVAIVVTALDLLPNFAPPSNTGTSGGIIGFIRSLSSPRTADPELTRDLIENISNASVETANIISTVETDTQEHPIDLFGVAVPADPQEMNQLQANSGHGFVTQGFDQVIRWLQT